ncbi:nuclease (SNase domain protein) [Methylocella silvestris BL2]|uniref:Nuclease (SNase domain protein) n=1 Tax=Methylocella silvestris (strain DSM 15510 / CIP 108128 / LMG 27833 / NCIMB 13906 / BL2) TaxID=395965 RepID=B8ERE2_METSB|nr:nuclease (SNase domain protein) [Methylocella silvestris BL2]
MKISRSKKQALRAARPPGSGPAPAKREAEARVTGLIAALVAGFALNAAPGRASAEGIQAAQAAQANQAANSAEDCAIPPASQGRRRVDLEKARVKSVDERLELTLDDGRRLKIAGLDPPRPTPGAPELDIETGQKLGAWLSGKAVIFRPVFTAPDRWGRINAEVFAPAGEDDGSPPISVAGAALDAGLARFESGAAGRRCRAFLLAAEGAARAAALGLWGDPYYAVIAASDRASFAEKTGTSVIVEGRVARVEEDKFRTLLLFGERRGWDFSVTILQRNRKLFTAAGLDVSTLKDKTVRVRGLLDMRFGPQIEIERPDEIEAMTPGQDAAAASSRR